MPTQINDIPPTRHAARGWRGQTPPVRDATTEQIADLAYRYWVERQKNLIPGSAIADWLRAEAELIGRREAAIDEASEESFPASDPPAR